MAWVAVGSAVAATTVGSMLNSGNGGGTYGGNPNAYIPLNQQGMDYSYNNNQSNYQTALNNMNGTVSPLNQQALQSQFNDPAAQWLRDNAASSSRMYNATAQKAFDASQQMYGQAGNTANWQNLVQNGMFHDAPQVQGAFDGMMGLANQSNGLYNDLIKYQQGQQGKVQGAANNLYSNGDQTLQTAFDPRSAIYNDTVNKLTDQSRAAQYARGIQSSPYGAAVESNALGNFNMDWQNQQLARQAQGLQAAQGAYQGAEGLNNAWTNNLSGLQTAMGDNYRGLTTAATGMMDNWSQAQANVANTFGSAVNRDYQTAGLLGNDAAASQYLAGQVPYNANQTIYGNQNQALQNYMNNMSPYMNGLNQLQSNALGYMNGAQGAQNQGFNQGLQNASFQNQIGQQIGGPLSSAFQTWWNTPSGGMATNNTGDAAWTWMPSGSNGYADGGGGV